MKQHVTGLVAILTLGIAGLATAGPNAPSQAAIAAGVAGTWTLAIQGGDHVVPMGLVLEQDGKKLTGTLMAQGKEVPLEGEFVDGNFWLTPTVKAEVHDQSGHGGSPLKLTGALLDDGTLKGEMPGPKGGIPWTAERLKKRK